MKQKISNQTPNIVMLLLLILLNHGLARAEPDSRKEIRIIAVSDTTYQMELTNGPSGNRPEKVSGTTMMLGSQGFFELTLEWDNNMAEFEAPNGCVTYMDVTVANDDRYIMVLDQSMIDAGYVKDGDGAGVFIGRKTGTLPWYCFSWSYLPLISG